METTMRYVQQRVENFTLRAVSEAVSEKWRDKTTVADPVSTVLVNLSLGGAEILMPKNRVLPANNLQLHIPSPQNPGIDDTSIIARVRWTDAYYSISRKKVGLQLMKYGDDDKIRLSKLIEWFAVCENAALPCSLQL
jgi:c-di-GMP-binding flagellar brake protein YcgR